MTEVAGIASLRNKISRNPPNCSGGARSASTLIRVGLQSPFNVQEEAHARTGCWCLPPCVCI